MTDSEKKDARELGYALEEFKVISDIVKAESGIDNLKDNSITSDNKTDDYIDRLS